MLRFNFILGLSFISLCFKLVIIYYHAKKQREIKIKPRIKLNHNIYKWDKPDGYAMLMSPNNSNKGETAVHSCHCPGDMAVRMYTVGWCMCAPCFKFVAYKWAFLLWLCRSARKVFPDSFFETMSLKQWYLVSFQSKNSFIFCTC